jgi:hypothetical protein
MNLLTHIIIYSEWFFPRFGPQQQKMWFASKLINFNQVLKTFARMYKLNNLFQL